MKYLTILAARSSAAFSVRALAPTRRAAPLALALVLGAGATVAFAQLARPIELHAPDSAGATLLTLDDLDGDGTEDLAYGTPQLFREATATWRGGLGLPFQFTDASCPVGDDGRGFVVLASGATGEPIRVLTAPEGSFGFGAAITLVGDLDQDGIRDLAVGAPGLAYPDDDERYGGIAGRVFAVSAANGSMLGEYCPPEPRRGFGARLATSFGPEGARVVVAIPDEWSRPAESGARVYFFDAVAASLEATLDRDPLPSDFMMDAWGGFAADIAALPDCNGDGRDDVALVELPTRSQPGALVVHCGLTGATIRVHEFGASTALVAVGHGGAGQPGEWGHAVLCRDADSGAYSVLRFAVDGTPVPGVLALGELALGPVPALVELGDLDDDGAPEFGVGPRVDAAPLIVWSGGGAVETATPPGTVLAGCAFARLRRGDGAVGIAVGALGGRYFASASDPAQSRPAFFVLFGQPAEIEVTAAATPLPY